jgi:hypothetical protein
MAGLYIMNVPEFSVLADAARRCGAIVTDLGDYLHASSPAGRLAIRREDQIRPAIWFAALTGGYTGTIARFDAEELWLDEHPARLDAGLAPAAGLTREDRAEDVAGCAVLSTGH